MSHGLIFIGLSFNLQSLSLCRSYLVGYNLYISQARFFAIYIVACLQVSVMTCCSPSVKPWRAARTHTIMLGFVLLALLMSFVAIIYSIGL